MLKYLKSIALQNTLSEHNILQMHSSVPFRGTLVFHAYIQFECGENLNEYSVEYFQSHRTLLSYVMDISERCVFV